jgi:hypothetical protein
MTGQGGRCAALLYHCSAAQGLLRESSINAQCRQCGAVSASVTQCSTARASLIRCRSRRTPTQSGKAGPRGVPGQPRGPTEAYEGPHLARVELLATPPLPLPSHAPPAPPPRPRAAACAPPKIARVLLLLPPPSAAAVERGHRALNSAEHRCMCSSCRCGRAVCRNSEWEPLTVPVVGPQSTHLPSSLVIDRHR